MITSLAIIAGISLLYRI